MTAQMQFDRLDAAWEERVSNHSISKYLIGPFCVQICHTSPGFEKIMRSLSHLKIACEEKPFDLSIRLWDASIPEHKLPPLHWDLLRHVPYSGCVDGPLYIQWFDYIHALSILHTEKKRAYYVVRNVQELPWWVDGAPLQVIFQAFLQHQGLQLTHTAAIGTKTKALLLSGKGGQGKSTTTLTCLDAGMHYLAEDYSILQPGDPPYVFSLYHGARWLPHTRTLFPQYEPWILNKDKTDIEKAQVFYQDIFPKQLRSSSPICAVVALCIGTQESPLLTPATPHETLQSLMMSTLKQLPFCGAKTMQILQNVIAPIPQYKLTLGKNLKKNLHCIQELLNCL